MTTTQQTVDIQSPKQTRMHSGKILSYLVLLALLFMMLSPFWWVLRTALTSPESVFSHTSSLLPVNPTTQNFERVLGLIETKDLIGEGLVTSYMSTATLNFWVFLRNSFIVSGGIALGQTLFSSMAAYAFARIRFPLRDKIFFIYLTGLMIPNIVLFIPNFVFVRQMDWIGTYQGIIAPTFLMTPFAVFFMRQFFLGLNKELEEAATIDGTSRIGLFWRIALPLVKGPLLTLAILTFIGSWNEYLWPLLVGRDEDVRVLTVALGIFREQTPQGSPDWAGLMAGAAVSIVPAIIIFVFFGRKVVDSIQFSGFK